MKYTTKKMELQIMQESNIRYDQFIYMESEYHNETNAMIEDNIAYNSTDNAPTRYVWIL